MKILSVGQKVLFLEKDSSITVMRIPTDEEYMICCDVEALMNK